MLRKLICAALFVTLASVASAATFPVSNPGEFQAALTAAQTNDQNDVINVAECSGTGCSVVSGFNVYDITVPLTYTADANEGFSLTIDGFDSDTRILRGIGVPILRIDTTAASEDITAIITVRGLTFAEGNNSGEPNDGGALYVLVNNAGVVVSGSVFGGNAADGDGGALFVRTEGFGELPIRIADVTFDTNSAGGDGGGAYIAGNSGQIVEVFDTEFLDNDAANGGGLHIEGLNPPDPVFTRVNYVEIFDTAFSDNIARSGNGGGANISTSAITVDIVGFVRNLAQSASGSGGGFYLGRNFSNFTMVNTGFVGNQASVDGGGFANEVSDGASIRITNNTIYGNSSDGRGGGALLTITGSVGRADVYNNIIYGNLDAASGQDIYIDNDPFTDIPAEVFFFNNNITTLTGFPDTSSSFGIASSTVLTSGNNIDAAPVLPNVLSADPDPAQGALSPTIDAGDNDAPGRPSRDWEFDARPQDGNGDMVATVDIGMDEFIGGALPSTDLSVTKTDSPDPVTGGENVTYSIVVTNAGPDEASGVTVTDTLDATATFVSAIFNQGTPCTTSGSPVVVTCVLGALASGNSAPGTIVVTSPVVEVVSGIANSVTVSGNEADPNSANNTAQQGTTVVPPAGPAMADLSITKLGAPDPVFSGGPDLTYTITVENAGPDPATGVTLSDTLPAGVTFQSASSTIGQCDPTPDAGGVLDCSLGDLAVTSNATLTIVVTPDIVTEPVTITNSATVTGAQEDPAPGNNTVAEDTVVNPPSSDIGLAISATPDSPLIDEQITYRVTVTNAGPSNNTGIVITVVLPPMTTFVSASSDQGSCFEKSGMLTCTIGDLAAGASVAVQIIVTGPGEAMMLTLSATVVADAEDPTPANNSISEEVVVIDVVDLVIQGKSKGSGSVGWIELLFLLTIAGVMAARAGWAQLRSGSRVLLPALLCVMSAMALMTASEVQAEENWYVGVAAGPTSLDYSAADLTSDLSSLGWTINNPSVDDSNTAWKVYAGFQFNEWFAVEAGYADLGEVVTQFGATIPPTQIDALLSDTLSVHPYQGDGWMVAGVVRYAFVPDQFLVVGRAGLFRWESKTTVRVISGGTGSVAGDDSGTDGMFGVGIEWQLNEQWSLTADWERYKLNEWLDVPSIGVRFSF